MNFDLYVDLIKSKKNLDLKKLSYQLTPEEMETLVKIIRSFLMSPIQLRDGQDRPLTRIKSQISFQLNHIKTLRMSQRNQYSTEAMTREVYSSLQIEQIESTKDSISRILQGHAPNSQSETGIYHMKQGLDFISNTENEITEENLLALYQLVIQDQLRDEDRPSTVTGYRTGEIYVSDSKMGKTLHTGIAFELLPERIAHLISFAKDPGDMDDLTAASILHFYLAWLHPWFDGNGRMARLLHMWYLIQKGYPSTLYTAMSEYILKSKKHYYQAFILCSQNMHYLGSLDVTPFVRYINTHVYSQITLADDETTSQIFLTALENGQITLKEKELWAFVISRYGSNEFSTKQLEKDFQDAAYQTIYKFVHKFKDLGLLDSKSYGNRVRYQIKH